MRSTRTRRWIASLLSAAALAGPRASGQTSNPVYVDDSPGAWEQLLLARQQSAENTGEAVRLYQELLDDDGLQLVPRHEVAPDEFVAVRGRVLADLRADAALLERYRVVQSAEAKRLLAAGDLERLVRTRSLTAPGLVAILRTAQDDLETARFHGALSWLDEALTHPDLSAESGAHARFMRGLAGHYLGRDAIVASSIEALVTIGPAAAECLAELRRLVSSGRGPAIERGATTLDATESTELTELVGQTIWSLELNDSLLNRRFNGGPTGVRSSSFDRRRRVGDLTTTAATVAGSTVYINEGHTVRAIDRFTGRSLWERTHRDQRTPPMDRDNTAGDLSIVAVEGDTLVTLTGHAYATHRSSDGRIICLDAKTGDRRWSTSLDRALNNRDYEGLFPHGAPVIAEQRVYVLARKVTPQMLTGCYVVALDLGTGAIDWVRHVASSGSKTKTARPFSSLVYRDGSLYVSTSIGAVASIDAGRGTMNWLRRWSVPVHVRGRTRQPWEQGGPVIAGDRVIAIAPDQTRVVVLDRTTGEVLESHDARSRDRWNNPAYLISTGSMVYGIGNEIRAFLVDALDHPVWRLPAPAQSSADDPIEVVEAAATSETLTLAGRVQPVSGAIVVPAQSGLMLVDSETGTVLHRLAINASGNPLSIDAQLIVAGADSLDAYMSLGRAEEMLRSRIAANPDDPDPALSLLQLGVRVDDLDLALEGAELARQAIGRTADPEGPRNELFTMLLEVHRRRVARTEREAESLYAMIGSVAANDEQRVAYLIAYGDGLAATAPERAVETFQSILSRPDLAATVRGEAGLLRPAGDWAGGRLRRLIAHHGDGIYAPQADYARRSLDHLLESGGDDGALAALATEFPFTTASTDAAVRAARLRLDRGDARLALAGLSDAWHVAPTPDRAGAILGAFVDTCVRDGRPEQARELLTDLARAGDPILDGPGGPRTATDWLADLTPDREADRAADRAAGRAPRIAPAGDRPAPLLSGRLLERVDVAGPAGPPDRALLLEPGQPEGPGRLRMLDADLETIWSAPMETAGARILHFDDDELLLWLPAPADDPQVVSINPRTGNELWVTQRLRDLFDARIAPGHDVENRMPNNQPFIPSETIPLLGHRAVYLAQRAGGLAAFDRARGGGLLWSVEQTIDEVHLVVAHEFGVTLVGFAREDERSGRLIPTLVVYDPRTGDERHRMRLQSRSGVVWAQADSIGSLMCASREGLEMIDLLTGSRRWTNLAFDTSETRRGWRAGTAAIVESRTGSLLSVDFRDGSLSEAFSTAARGNWGRNRLEDLRIDEGRIFAHHSDRIIRYDAGGAIIGADVVSENRDYRWLLPAGERLVVVSQFEARQVAADGAARRQTQRTYRTYLLSENCRLEGMSELEKITRKLVDARLMDGWLLLSTDLETLAVPMGPAKD